MGGKRKRNVVLVADGVTVEKPILSKEEELQWEKRATHHAELLKKQQAGEEMKLKIRQEKHRLREEEAEHRRRLIRSTKVAQIMTRIAEIKQLRREIVEEEALVTRDYIWDDKLDCFREWGVMLILPPVTFQYLLEFAEHVCVKLLWQRSSCGMTGMVFLSGCATSAENWT
jgi:hypothetical protein